MRPPLILTIDVGTTSTRAMVFDADGHALPACLAHTANRLSVTPDGGATFDADELLTNLVTVIDEVLQATGTKAAQIAGVAIATFVGNILGVDAEGRPVTPVYTYADTRSAPDVEALRRELGAAGAAAAHERTGCPVHAAYLPPRFRWLERVQPHDLAAVNHWLSIGDYLRWRLTGRRGVSLSVAAWSGLLDRRTLTWDAVWLAQLPVDSIQLSPLVDIDEPVVGLTEPWRGRWPALADVPWFPALGDGAAANIGSGCDSPERVALTVGTTGALRVVVDPDLPALPSGLWLYRVSARRGLLGGATTEGGNVFAWLHETLQLPPPAELEQALAGAEPASHGLSVLPFWGGERAPGWNERARAVLSGLSFHTRPVDLVQAALEGITYRFALIYRQMLPLLPAGQTITASGGALLRSPAWLQIVADVLGRPVTALLETELTSRGCALLALEALGLIARTSELPPARGHTFLPDINRHRLHVEALQRHVALYEQLYGGQSAEHEESG